MKEEKDPRNGRPLEEDKENRNQQNGNRDEQHKEELLDVNGEEVDSRERSDSNASDAQAGESDKVLEPALEPVENPTEEQLAAWEELFFNEDEADEEEEREYREHKARSRKRWKKTISLLISFALLANVLAFWPTLYNSAAVRFVVQSRELLKNEAVAQYRESIVVISSIDGRKGTGFLISEDGMIATNHHVIDGMNEIFVSFADGPAREAEVIISDASVDLALVQLKESDTDRPVLPLNSSPEPWKPDEPVYVIGNPLFFNFIANEGTVYGEIPVRGLEVPVLALQAPIYRGNSGSPVINTDGEVIAVVYATTQLETDGDSIRVGLAVPVEHLLSLLEE